MFALVLDGCDNPFSIDDSLKTTIESYIINEHPTCPDGCIPTFYTHQDVLCMLQKRGGKIRVRVED